MRLLSKRKKQQNNKGYSLIELIITIAIIVVMTGVSLVTLSMIGSARAREAAVSFESELADLISRSKNQICIIDGEKHPELNFCLKVYKSGDKYYAKKGYYNSAATADLTVEMKAGDAFSNTYRYYFFEGENGSKNLGTGFSSKVKITYTGEDGVENEIDEDGVYIIYNRNGRCIGGSGRFDFYKRSSNGQIAYIQVNKNGSHQSK
ncbi:MAG: prepilin-type N-terminal cleavage/methylation domain-containing protein [Eubacteriales bacterium]|nr:prepilin-type N-terminal cleavage/methylation domain-containing protein [Lachnospiraceae bacterium]MDO5127478.1 prepilin-type N-terminal cleavage/methylation domain-containing protein [Eubacteriales bacterium]